LQDNHLAHHFVEDIVYGGVGCNLFAQSKKGKVKIFGVKKDKKGLNK
jgi:hypothetical protein